MTLTDAGPLIALLDKGDEHHRASVEASSTLPHQSMLTTWACFTEAMYVLGEIGGSRYRAGLWELRSRGALKLHDLSKAEVDRAKELMHRYSDLPMDLGDATLVAAAERLNLRRVFTFDHHFRIYRMPDGSVLEMVPG